MEELFSKVFTTEGTFVSKFGSKGCEPGQFDRPSGLCLSPGTHIVHIEIILKILFIESFRWEDLCR